MRELQKITTSLNEELLRNAEIYSYYALPQLNIRTDHE